VLELYGDAPEAVLALYMLGRTSERKNEKLSSFDTVDYDVRPLKDARRHYERFLEEADRMRKLPDPAKKWVDGILSTVRERLAAVYEKMLRKQLKVAEYYDWKGPAVVGRARTTSRSSRTRRRSERSCPPSLHAGRGPGPPEADRAVEAVIRRLFLLLALAGSSCGYEVGNLMRSATLKWKSSRTTASVAPMNSI
jgi:hypothetical protein